MFEFDLEPLTTGIGDAKQNEIRTSVDGLGVGMYVTRLDRPWIETTLPSGGFRINSQEQIELIRKVSRFVYVDTQKGESPDHRYWTLEQDQLRLNAPSAAPIFKKERSNEYTRLKQCSYEITTALEAELKTAREAEKRISDHIRRIRQELQQGKSLDIGSVKQGVAAIVDSIIRNPAAFNLLVQRKDEKDYSHSHSLATSVWCAQFGRHLGLKKDDISALALGGILLDIGKIRIPDAILNKQGGFTKEELAIIHSHVDHSVRIAAKSGGVPQKVLRMIATHHERANGSGYPEGLHNAQIPLFGRIAGIVDSYDAMTSIRPYNQLASTPHDAINELYDSRDDLFEAELVEQFIQTVGLYPTGSLVEFQSGHVGVVVAVHDLKRLYPTVMLLLDSRKRPLPESITVDLSAGDGEGLRIANGLPYGAYGIKMDELF